jgi:hypothetical protein
MADETKDVSTQRLLGQLLEGQSARKADVSRLEDMIRTGFEGIHRRIDPLVILPQQITAHMGDDAREFAAVRETLLREHDENKGTLGQIVTEIGTLKTERDMRRGAKAFAHALSAAIGALVAVAATLLKLKGAP